MLRKLFGLIFIAVDAQFMPGSQVDVSGHGCVIDGGYQWCDELNTCIRPWETECNSLQVIDPLPCQRPCPIPPPCPMPYIPNIDMNNCRIATNTDECGCEIGCPSYHCSNVNCNSDLDCQQDQFCRPMQMRLPASNGRITQNSLSECVNKVGVNESCGGYTPPEFDTRCLDNLECINSMGPMIAAAPGQCKERCPINSRRNQYGNCLSIPTIPENCATWHDGCNTCQVQNGVAEICTLMYCFRQDTPYCMNYHIQQNSLEIGDICYQFCEDGSQESINRRSDCPFNTKCINPLQNSEIVSFDNCNNNAWICQMTNH